MGYLEFTDFFSGKWHCGGDYPKVFVTRVYHWGTGIEAFVWASNVNLDYDGQSDAYGPPAKGPKDYLVNAGKGSAKGWYGVASYSETERDQINARLAKAGSKENIRLDTGPGLGQSTRLSGRKLFVNGNSVTVEPQIRYPVIQQAVNGDPNPGFYVSATSLVARPDLPEWKQNRYIDGSKIPFGALSGKLRKEGKLAMGDYGLAIRLDDPTGLSKTSGFSFLDAGGENEYAVGECSYKVFTELGGVSRNNNFVNAFIVFPYSKRYDANVNKGIESQLRSLSNADNADDLPMLMAFCGQAGKGGAGLELWKKYQGLSGPEQVKAPRPANYLNVVNGLRAWGYTGYPGV